MKLLSLEALPIKVLQCLSNFAVRQSWCAYKKTKQRFLRDPNPCPCVIVEYVTNWATRCWTHVARTRLSYEVFWDSIQRAELVYKP